MNPTILLAEVERYSDMDELTKFLSDQPDQGKLRQILLDDFRTVVEYETALEWSRAVRLCEALAVVGWDPWERVDAIGHFNGDCWTTQFVNHKGEARFRFGRWKKRKAGWVLFNPAYHFSADVPELPSRDALADKEFPVVDLRCLPSQRNYQKQMPIIMGVIGGSDPTTNHIFALKRRLTELLSDSMHPNEYGDALERFYLTLYGAGLRSKESSGLKVGAYRPKERAFYCEVHFERAFGQLTLDQQKAFFRSVVDRAVDALEAKFAKRRLRYDFQAFRSDLQAAFRAWDEEA
jgi:hypothetical protein